MSLARTALRIAAVSALNADPTISVLCPDRVFDSRIDDLETADPVPVIVVYTEDDHGKAYSANNGGPPFDHQCDLLLEISLRVMTTAIGDDGQSQAVIGMPETDAEAEATLDLLEERAVEAVTVADTPQAYLIRSAVTRRCTELKSVRYASAESGSKLALRMVTLATHLKINQAQPIDAPATGPFAVLPEPLRTVAAAQPEGSSTRTLCLAIASKLSSSTDSILTGIDTAMQPVSCFDPDNPPDRDDPLAPETLDGSIDINDD